MNIPKTSPGKICLIVSPFNKGEVIRKGQFALDVFPVEEIKSFMRLLFHTDIENALIWFDKLDCNVSLQRQEEKDMNLDKFLSNFQDEIFVRLQIGSPTEGIIRFGAKYRLKNHPSDHWAWFQCDLTVENYKKIDELFKKAFGVRIEETI